MLTDAPLRKKRELVVASDRMKALALPPDAQLVKLEEKRGFSTPRPGVHKTHAEKTGPLRPK